MLEDSSVLLTGTLNANNALTFANLAAGSTITLVLTQDATGNRTLSIEGSSVAVNPTAASVTLIRVYSPDGSTVYIDAPGVDPAIVGAAVSRTTNQSIPNNTTPQVTFNTEVWDTHGFVNLATQPTRITIPTGWGGLYEIKARTTWATNNTGQRGAYILRNGTNPNIAGDSRPASAEGEATLSTEYPLAAGDYLELTVKQVSGGSLNLGSAGFVDWPRLSVRRLGPSPA